MGQESQRLLSSILEEIGLAVRATASGEEAMVMLKAAADAGSPHQLAVVDIRMPGPRRFCRVRKDPGRRD